MRLGLMFVFLFFLGCATFPTPYQPEVEALAKGYHDLEVGPNKYLVGFRGNAYTTRNLSEKYAFRRAKEICIAKGYSQFDLISKTTSTAEINVSARNVCNKVDDRTFCNNIGGKEFQDPDVELIVTCVK